MRKLSNFMVTYPRFSNFDNLGLLQKVLADFNYVYMSQLLVIVTVLISHHATYLNVQQIFSQQSHNLTVFITN